MLNILLRLFYFLSILITGPIGMLITRVLAYNGSTAHWWLYFFTIPPISIIPAFLLGFNIIKLAPHPNFLRGLSVTDFFSWPGIVGYSVVSQIIINLFCNASDFNSFLSLAFSTGLFVFIARLYRKTMECNPRDSKPYLPLINETSGTIIGAVLAQLLLSLITLIPYVGPIFKIILKTINLFPGLMVGFLLTFGYLSINAYYKYNHTELIKSCHVPKLFQTKIMDWVKTLGLSTVSTIAYYIWYITILNIKGSEEEEEE